LFQKDQNILHQFQLKLSSQKQTGRNGNFITIFINPLQKNINSTIFLGNVDTLLFQMLVHVETYNQQHLKINSARQRVKAGLKSLRRLRNQFAKGLWHRLELPAVLVNGNGDYHCLLDLWDLIWINLLLFWCNVVNLTAVGVSCSRELYPTRIYS
jgi:hypothetical protein